MEKYGGFSELWAKGDTGFTGKGTVVQNIDEKIKKGKNDPFKQVKGDLITLDEDQFKKKYGKKKKKVRKELANGTYVEETNK